jgi:hypothetical protein
MIRLMYIYQGNLNAAEGVDVLGNGQGWIDVRASLIDGASAVIIDGPMI